jgi:hypothetical protein
MYANKLNPFFLVGNVLIGYLDKKIYKNNCHAYMFIQSKKIGNAAINRLIGRTYDRSVGARSQEKLGCDIVTTWRAREVQSPLLATTEYNGGHSGIMRSARRTSPGDEDVASLTSWKLEPVLV